MALNRVSNMSEPDWLSQTHKKNYRNISHVVIRFFSVVVIPKKHSSLYIKKTCQCISLTLCLTKT